MTSSHVASSCQLSKSSPVSLLVSDWCQWLCLCRTRSRQEGKLLLIVGHSFTSVAGCKPLRCDSSYTSRLRVRVEGLRTVLLRGDALVNLLPGVSFQVRATAGGLWGTDLQNETLTKWVHCDDVYQVDAEEHKLVMLVYIAYRKFIE